MRLIDADALKGPLELLFSSYARIGAAERAEAYAHCLWEIDQAPTIGGWISVKDRLPEEEEQECWVWCPRMDKPEIDTWEGNRGETGVCHVIPDGTAKYIKSGWFHNDMEPITHWMPIWTPEPPEEVTGDE